jgi:hypothetical protein
MSLTNRPLFGRASYKHRRSADKATPGFPMVDLENGSVGYKAAGDSSSTSTPSASSPTEAAHLTHTNEPGGIPTPSYSPEGLATLRRLVPRRLTQICKQFASWMKGPQPARPYKIKPIFEIVQTAPTRLLDRRVPQHQHRLWILAGYYILWLLLLVIVLRKSTSTGKIGELGPPLRLSCISRLW